MKKLVREISRQMSRLNTKATITCETETRKHPKLVLEYLGARRVIPFACSPQDETDALSGTMRQVRQALREMGA